MLSVDKCLCVYVPKSKETPNALFLSETAEGLVTTQVESKNDSFSDFHVVGTEDVSARNF